MSGGGADRPSSPRGPSPLRGWTAVLVAYAVAVPIVCGVVFLGPREGSAVLASALGLVVLVTVGIPMVAAAMIRHGVHDRPADADWDPHVVASLVGPAAVAGLAYVLSSTFRGSAADAAGDATYALLGAFWLASVAYLYRWWAAAT